MPLRDASSRLVVSVGAAALLGTLAHGFTPLRTGDHTIRLEHASLSRQYLVHVPGKLGTGRPAVVLALHGGGGSASQFQQDSGLDAVADREGFLSVYPDGTGPLRNRLLTWNAGPHCCGWAAQHGVDDVAFLDAVLDDLAERLPFDAGRVYAIGHSNGSMMAYRLAAERPGRVAAIVAVAGAMDVTLGRATQPVAVLHIHSVDDPRALYGGGVGPPFPGTDHRVDHQPVMRSVAAWAWHNGCAAEPRIEDEREAPAARARRPARTPRAGRQTATRLVYEGCRPGGQVEHLRLTGVGHGWPGANVPRSRERLIGPGTTLVRASEEAWTFLSRFSR